MGEEKKLWLLVACGKWPKCWVPSRLDRCSRAQGEEGGEGNSPGTVPTLTHIPTEAWGSRQFLEWNSSGSFAECQSWGLSCHLSIISVALPLMSATSCSNSAPVLVQPYR